MARPPGDSARDRLNLFLAIVPFVLLKKSVSIAEVAEHFGTTPKKVADAVETIACDGGVNEARYNYNTELFNIDWEEFLDNKVIVLTVAEVMHVPAPFSARQRAVFLAGLELLKSHPHYRRLPELESLITKLRGDESNAVTDVFGVELAGDHPVANIIQDAIDSNRRIRFHYTNNEGKSGVREVDPYRQDLTNSQWYLKGHCYDRKEIRTFNLDSVKDLEILDTPIEPRSIDAFALNSELFSESESDIHVRIAIDPRAIPLIAPYRRPGDKPVETGDVARITIPFSHEGAAVRMLSVLPGIAVAEEPADIRSAVASFARTALDAYAQTP